MKGEDVILVNPGCGMVEMECQNSTPIVDTSNLQTNSASSTYSCNRRRSTARRIHGVNSKFLQWFLETAYHSNTTASVSQAEKHTIIHQTGYVNCTTLKNDKILKRQISRHSKTCSQPDTLIMYDWNMNFNETIKTILRWTEASNHVFWMDIFSEPNNSRHDELTANGKVRCTLLTDLLCITHLLLLLNPQGTGELLESWKTVTNIQECIKRNLKLVILVPHSIEDNYDSIKEMVKSLGGISLAPAFSIMSQLDQSIVRSAERNSSGIVTWLSRVFHRRKEQCSTFNSLMERWGFEGQTFEESTFGIKQFLLEAFSHWVQRTLVPNEAFFSTAILAQIEWILFKLRRNQDINTSLADIISQFTTAIQIAQQNDIGLICVMDSYIHLAKMKHLQEDQDSAKIYLDQAVRLLITLPNKEEKTRYTEILGDVAFEFGQHGLALHLINTAKTSLSCNQERLPIASSPRPGNHQLKKIIPSKLQPSHSILVRTSSSPGPGNLSKGISRSSARTIVRLGCKLSRIYHVQGREDSALKEMIEAIHLGEQNGLLSVRSSPHLLYCLGFLYQENHHASQAFLIYQLTSEIGRRHKMGSVIVRTLFAMGQLIYQEENNASRAKKYFEEGLKMSRYYLGQEALLTGLLSFEIARILQLQNDGPNTLILMERATSVFLDKLGENHPATLSCVLLLEMAHEAHHVLGDTQENDETLPWFNEYKNVRKVEMECQDGFTAGMWQELT